MRVKEGYTELTVPHEGKERTFQYPSFKGIYRKVIKQIKELGLSLPNSAQTASLVYDAFQNPNGEYESEIIKILKGNWFWEFPGNLYLPKSEEEISNGVILDNNPSIVNRKLLMDKNSLVKRLNEDDSTVKFVPFGFKIGEQSWQELEKNPYIIARYGEEGAGKIAKIASKKKFDPILWSFGSVDEEKTRVSALDYGWYFSGLYVYGGWGGEGHGHAFGIVPEKNSPEKFEK